MIIRELRADDREQVREMLTACGAFSDEEIRVALEMAATDEYSHWAAEITGKVRGFACVGKAPLTTSTWYLYWTCIHPQVQKMGVGCALHAHVENFVRAQGGERLVLETSSRPDYGRTHDFYRKIGYREVGCIEHFYKRGDDCLILCKALA